MANPDEAFGQDVEEEASQELRSQKRHLSLLAAVGVVLPPEDHAFPVKSEEPMVGNGDPMRVSAQVAEDLGGTAECRFGVDDPVLPMQPPQ